MGRKVGRGEKDSVALTHHILGKPDPTVAINVNPHSYTVERSAGQVNEMPAPRSLVDHTFLHGINVVPGRCRWAGQADALATIRESCKPFVGNAHALI